MKGNGMQQIYSGRKSENINENDMKKWWPGSHLSSMISLLCININKSQ